jgi:hypothetical protein
MADKIQRIYDLHQYADENKGQHETMHDQHIRNNVRESSMRLMASGSSWTSNLSAGKFEAVSAVEHSHCLLA